MTGPMSVERRSGFPTCSSRIAPRNISRTRSADSSCRQSSRRAEQRWPAESKADTSASATTCSASAEESTTMALSPPVSAINVTGLPQASSRPLIWRLIVRATSVDPVKITACTWCEATSAAPIVSPSPGSNWSAPAGTPASCRILTAAAATRGVCSAGLASTVLPAASAAAICPVKMASGKFQGLMQATTPSARSVSLDSDCAACAP